MLKNYRLTETPRIALSGAPETAEQVGWLKEQGIGAVLSLHPVPAEAAAALREQGLAHLDYCLRDFCDPLPGDFGAVRRFLEERAAGGLLIH